METIEKLIAKDEALLTLDVRSNPEEIKKYIDEEFREIGTSAHKIGFEEILEVLPKSVDWKAEIYDIESKILTQDVIVLIYKAKIQHTIKSKPVESIRSSVWKRGSNGWKIVFHQGTKIEKETIVA